MIEFQDISYSAIKAIYKMEEELTYKNETIEMLNDTIKSLLEELEDYYDKGAI
jgi:hypothetical protein